MYKKSISCYKNVWESLNNKNKILGITLAKLLEGVDPLGYTTI